MIYREHLIERDEETGFYDIASGKFSGNPWLFEVLTQAKKYIDLRCEGMELRPKALADAIGAEVVEVGHEE